MIATSTQIPMQMLAFGLLLLAAHIVGKLSERFGLSEVVGQVLGGALAGPYVLKVLGLFSPEFIKQYKFAFDTFHFFIIVFLCMVAFGLGEELYLNKIKKVGKSAFIICIIQVLSTWAAISTSFILLSDFPVITCLILGSIGIATAPAVTFIVLNKLKIRGRLKSLLANIVVIDDLLEVIVFSLLIQVAIQQDSQSLSAGSLVLPVAMDLLYGIIVGAIIYLALRILISKNALSLELADPYKKRPRSKVFLEQVLSEPPSPSVGVFIFVMSIVSIGAGISYYFHWPFLITAIFAGFLVANFHSHAIFTSLKLDNLFPVMALCFFAMIGAKVSFDGVTASLVTFIILYILARTVGKLFGTWFACFLVGESKEVRRTLPILMLPQAGVAAVEAVFAGMILGDPKFTAIILPAIIFFEVAGVFLSTRTLKKWQKTQSKESDQSKKERFVVAPQQAAGTICSYLREDFINLDLRGNNISEVLMELADHAIENSDEHIDRAEILQMLGDSENLSSSSLGNGVSLPSCRTHGLPEPILVFGQHSLGIDFGGNNRIPSQIFLLMICNVDDEKEFMTIRASALNLFSNHAFVEKILHTQDKKNIVKTFLEVKEGVSPYFKLERREIVKWEKKYHVDNIEIDAQHERLFKVINNFYNGLILGSTEESIRELICELRDYANVHFRSEEDLMLEHEYPHSEKHINMHKEFLEKVNSLEEAVKHNTSAMHVDLLNYLTIWIKKHIYEVDKQYANYFREKGIDNWY